MTPQIIVAYPRLDEDADDELAGFEIARDDLENEAANELESQAKAELQEIVELLWPSARF